MNFLLNNRSVDINWTINVDWSFDMDFFLDDWTFDADLFLNDRSFDVDWSFYDNWLLNMNSLDDNSSIIIAISIRAGENTTANSMAVTTANSNSDTEALLNLKTVSYKVNE